MGLDLKFVLKALLVLLVLSAGLFLAFSAPELQRLMAFNAELEQHHT